jgi:hypothetical protein
VNVPVGQPATLTISADGTGALTYQWRRDDVDLVDSENISGAATPMLTIASVSAADAGLYDCLVTLDVCGIAVSNDADLGVVLGPVDITWANPPQDNPYLAG